VRESSFFSTVRSSVRVSLARVNVCGEIAVRCDPHEVAPRLAARRQRRTRRRSSRRNAAAGITVK